MHDRDVVSAIVAGNPAGLAAAYDRYAGPLYSFCAAMLREPADAADAVQDTFVIAASSLSRLRNPMRLRPWLYAVARNECRQRLRGGSRWVPFEAAGDVAADAADVTSDLEKAELRALVRDALGGLGPAEREVLEMQLRHGLTSDEVAGVLGISLNHCHALLSRARSQLETSLAGLILARAGRRDCPALDALLEGWDDRLTVLLRKRLNRHVRGCAACSGRQRQEMVPSAFLGIPLLAAAALPRGFKDTVLRAATGHPPAPAAHSAAPTAWTFGHHGFPRPLNPPRSPWWHTRLAHAGALTGAAAVIASTATVVAMPPHHVAPPPTGGTTGATGVAGPVPGSAVGAGPTPSVSDGTVVTASVTPGGSGTSASRPATVPAAPFRPVSTSASASASASGTLSVTPTTLDVVPPATGTITLTASGGSVGWSVSEPSGLTKKVVVSPMSGTLAADATTTVTVTIQGPGKPHVHLVFSPGGTQVTVVVG
jgi:RNA polymerase sigma factor (sigma-70 family)